MPVAPLVMQPGGGIAFVLAFAVVGAVGAKIVFCAHEKFGGGIFAQVVGQALPVKPQAETAFQDQPFMVRNGFEVLNRMQTDSPFAI